MNEKLNKAEDLLKEALGTLIERGKLHDKAGEEERSLGAVAEMMTALKGQKYTAQDIGLVQICVKLVRSQQGNYHHDNFVDLAGYAALTGEEAHREHLHAESLKTQAISQGSQPDPYWDDGETISAEIVVSKARYKQVGGLAAAMASQSPPEWLDTLRKIGVSYVPQGQDAKAQMLLDTIGGSYVPQEEDLRLIVFTVSKSNLNGEPELEVFKNLVDLAVEILQATPR